MLTLNSFRQKVISASTPIVYSSNSGGSKVISVVAAILAISAIKLLQQRNISFDEIIGSRKGGAMGCSPT